MYWNIITFNLSDHDSEAQTPPTIKNYGRRSAMVRRGGVIAA